MNDLVQEVASILAQSGMQHAFGVTGSGLSLRLITELEDRGISYLPASHEASAAMMAGAVTQASGQLSGSVSVKGPGLANMLPGILLNHYECRGAISISEAYDAAVPQFRKHKRLDHRGIIGPIVKSFGSLNALDSLACLCEVATQEIPGPVHLDLSHGKPEEREAISASEKRTSMEGKFFKLLQKSSNLVVIVGSLGCRRAWKTALENLQAPVLTTVSAKGVLDEKLPHAAGVFTGAGKSLAPELELIDQADLIVGLALRNAEVLEAKRFSRPMILVDEVDGLSEGFQPEAFLLDARGTSIPAILEQLQMKSCGLDVLRKLQKRMSHHILNSKWLPALCFDVLNRLSYDYALVLDTGSFCTIGEHIWQARRQRPFMGSSNARFMGASIPSAIGMALAHDQKPVFCVLGDGGVRMYTAEIRLAIERKLPVCFILMTDGVYGSIRCVPQNRIMSPTAVSVPAPSWWEAIGAMQCESSSVKSGDHFAEVISHWNRRNPLFVEASFDRDSYAEMTRLIR